MAERHSRTPGCRTNSPAISKLADRYRRSARQKSPAPRREQGFETGLSVGSTGSGFFVTIPGRLIEWIADKLVDHVRAVDLGQDDQVSYLIATGNTRIGVDHQCRHPAILEQHHRRNAINTRDTPRPAGAHPASAPQRPTRAIRHHQDRDRSHRGPRSLVV